MEKAFSCDIILSMNDEKSQATRHDLYEKLWAARDFEISHQWQRSVFLATFLVLLFTMYFTVLGNYVDLVKDSEQVSTNIYTTTVIAQMNHSQDSGHSPFLLYLPIALYCICFCGYTVSVLWICMARGSKYSYERLEVGINKSYESGFFDESTQHEFDMEYARLLLSPTENHRLPRHGYLPEADYAYSLFSLNGAKFSSSKINILLGYLFSLAWIFLTLLSFIIHKGVFPSTPTLLMVLVAEVFIYTVVSFFILSGKKMLFTQYVQILFSRNNNRIAKRNHLEWVKEIIDEEVDSDDASTHIIPTLMAYTDGNLKFNKLHRDLERLTELGGTISKKQVQFILNDDELNIILECTLMQRTSFNASFQGDWEGPRTTFSIGRNASLRDSFIGLLNQCTAPCSNKMWSIEIAEENEIKLFADTQWGKIEAGDEFEIDSDERVYRIIYEGSHFSSRLISIELKLDDAKKQITCAVKIYDKRNPIKGFVEDNFKLRKKN